MNEMYHGLVSARVLRLMETSRGRPLALRFLVGKVTVFSLNMRSARILKA